MSDYRGHNSYVRGDVIFGDRVAGDKVVYGPSRTQDERTPRQADVGVLTILNEETVAIRGALQRMSDFRVRQLPAGLIAAEAWLPDRIGNRVNVAAVQALEPGHAQAVSAQTLVSIYRPAVVLLVGIAGGNSDHIVIGDVVVSDHVVSYDPGSRRPETLETTALLRYRVNDFLAQVPPKWSYRILKGPVGSPGGASDAEAVHGWLASVNEKVLAVETNAGAVDTLRLAMRENADLRGWLSIRGIAGIAGPEKNDTRKASRLAAEHAADVMAMLLPFLSFERQ
ncbi:hypothetical protein ABZ652_24010 [Micromonospora chalcea]|uniref:phosphorylase family protein n=1 Tax=Micromonospora chalcea TaxID=1874 RepID=UPI003407F996